MKIKNWQTLQAGDIVDIVSPGFRSHPEDISNAMKILKSWGLVPRYPKASVGKHYLNSNTDENRSQFFIDALKSDDSKVIWCTRGGYGSIRLLPKLERELGQLKKSKSVKLLIGISDITSLHVFLNQKLQWPSLHAHLLDRLGNGKLNGIHAKRMRSLLFGNQDNLEISGLRPLNQAARNCRHLRAPLMGGNLTVLQSTLATPTEFSAAGKILFLEELAERAYRIDRILQQFSQAKKISKASAVVFGDFLNCHEPDGKKLYPLVLKDWAEKQSCPVFWNLKAGHADIQHPLFFNTSCEISRKSSGKFSLCTWAKANGVHPTKGSGH